MLCWLHLGFNTCVFDLSVNIVSRQNELNKCKLPGKARSCKIRIVSVVKNKVKRM